MFLQSKSTESLIKITDLETLFSPLKDEITGKIQEGQEEQDSISFSKNDLLFPSGENLPRCWVDSNYRT